ncbi:MAG: hypothetical protein EHM80_16535 [Nitrospiraceae bacterium]|nr:MAG: hypothetical protein EHM80_16535 [Nitrospiraceae bacterium]
MKNTPVSDNPKKPDLIDRIANALPEQVRSDYYRELRHCRSLPENDEMLRLLRAMQFLTILMVQVPADLTRERERLDHTFRSAMQKVQESLNAGTAYQKLLDERLTDLPGQISQGINPATIAMRINESLRQQFAASTIPETARALTQSAESIKNIASEFGRMAGPLIDSYRGVAERARQTIDSIRLSIDQASESASRAARELSSTFRHEYRWALYALSCLALLVGIGTGMLIQQRLDRSSEPKEDIDLIRVPVRPLPPVRRNP